MSDVGRDLIQALNDLPQPHFTCVACESVIKHATAANNDDALALLDLYGQPDMSLTRLSEAQEEQKRADPSKGRTAKLVPG